MSAPVSQMSAAALPAGTEQLALVAALRQPAEGAGASRLRMTDIRRHIQGRHDFGFETTLAGRGYLRLIRRLKAIGWTVELIYLALPTPDMAKLRVAERVSHGGHDFRFQISNGDSFEGRT